eukprot:TRINITY_DN16755_c0_g1_i1.p1 TRINITY_DN16755_c0_g1~~TRINITY_DN16755_c0_g1_i1.p1  ORF type:complete len:255 (+),score=56.84 TRINITY_DN16755_c0_g1_i1:45-809(+)
MPRPSLLVKKLWVAIFIVVVVMLFTASMMTITDYSGPVEVVIIPGGGQTPTGPPEHMKLRLQGAAEIYEKAPISSKPKIMVLSGGTPHKPNPLDEHGFDIKEAECSARYLMNELKIPSDAIIEDAFSLDTYGNAYWSRVLHCDPAGYRNVVVVNNRWHIPRTKMIFNWVYSLTPVRDRPYNVQYVSVGDGLDPDILKIRLQKEEKAKPGVAKLTSSMATMPEFHKWLFSQHGAYKTARLLEQRQTIDPKLAKSY